MPHQYSVEIHEFLSKQLDEIDSALENGGEGGKPIPEKQREYLNGKKDEVLFFRNLLSEKFDLSNRKYY